MRAALMGAVVSWGFSAQAQQMAVTKYNIDKVAVKWNNMEARLTVDADWPEGQSPQARTLQRWLCELMAPTAQVSTGRQLMECVEADFVDANSVEAMKSMAEDGAREGRWFYNRRAKKEYEGKHIVSYTYSWSRLRDGCHRIMLHRWCCRKRWCRTSGSVRRP